MVHSVEWAILAKRFLGNGILENGLIWGMGYLNVFKADWKLQIKKKYFKGIYTRGKLKTYKL